jgi:hypothetical protein
MPPFDRVSSLDGRHKDGKLRIGRHYSSVWWKLTELGEAERKAVEEFCEKNRGWEGLFTEPYNVPWYPRRLMGFETQVIKVLELALREGEGVMVRVEMEEILGQDMMKEEEVRGMVWRFCETNPNWKGVFAQHEEVS